MFFLKGAFVLFMSLAIGYVLCILAKKQEGVLKTLGYTLGVAIIALSLLAAAVESSVKSCMMGKSIYKGKGMKACGAKFMKGHHK